jgi:hypothetical protein
LEYVLARGVRRLRGVASSALTMAGLGVLMDARKTVAPCSIDGRIREVHIDVNLEDGLAVCWW